MLLLFVFLHQEEIPFSEYQNFDAKLPDIIYSILQRYNIDAQINCSVLSSSIAFGIESSQQSFQMTQKTFKGPNISAPQSAIDGFLRKYGINKEQCTTDNKKNIIYTIPETVLSVQEMCMVLSEEIIDESGKVFTQLMPTYGIQWVRPINSISVFCNGKTIQTKFDNASIKVRHNIIATDNAISWSDYIKICNDNGIVLYYAKRKEYIESEVNKQANRLGLLWKNNTIAELACLYDSPKLCVAEFPEKYLSLPQEVLRLTIEKTQRYIILYKDGIIQNQICIIGKVHNEQTTYCHIKTIKARLDDAAYYISKDIDSFETKCIAPSLEKIIFHQKYGSIYKRITEMQSLAQKIFGNDIKLQDAIMLCKNDLNSHIVQSFPELQGYMSGYYLERVECDSDIYKAVAEHYKPLGPSDDLPKTVLGLKLSFIDKLHKVNTLADIGEIPTSSRDPFAIRRDILSIIRIARYLIPEFTIESLKVLVNSALHGFVDERSKSI